MNNRIEEILYAYLSKEKLSEEDMGLLRTWLSESGNAQEFGRFASIKERFRIEEDLKKRNKDKVWKEINSGIKFKESVFTLRWFASMAAAVVIFALVITAVWKFEDFSSVQRTAEKYDIIKPGGNSAKYILASGESISLGDSLSENIVSRGGDTIVKLVDKELLLCNVSNKKSSEYHEIKVPRGGEFQFVLSDGTKVWLNSETELRFPVSFDSAERKVYLSGEASFNVHHDKTKPFTVVSDRQNVKVFGTVFNVKDYKDEEIVQTTLVEGSVKVYDRNSKLSKFLKPGEQSELGKDKLYVHRVDVNQYVSWKYGDFIFKQERLENIMKQISRWYDVEVFYLNERVKDYYFTAWFKKEESIETIVRHLEETRSIKVRIKNKTIVISEIIK